MLWLRDLTPGAGWGVLDHHGAPKVAWHHLRRALAPVAVWTTDEGLNGVAVHVANDRPNSLAAELRVALYAGEREVGRGEVTITVPPYTAVEDDAEAILGRWADAAYAYRFGPPAHDVVVATLARGGVALAQAFRFPVGPPATRADAAELGARAWIADGALVVDSRALLYGVRVHLPGRRPADDAFHVAPGERRVVGLTPPAARPNGAPGHLTALNLAGRLYVDAYPSEPP